MHCPYCETAFNNHSFDDSDYIHEVDRIHFLSYGKCPECNKLIIILYTSLSKTIEEKLFNPEEYEPKIIFPQTIQKSVPEEVPETYRNDFKEAVSVISISPKASAALSRRILQHILREQYKIKHKNLAKEINEFVTLKDIPSYLSEAVDAVRNIGNFAAHPLKETNTGSLIEVEPGEAEWLLEVLESLFDFTFVQPKRLEKRKTELNRKLKALGKPKMK